MRFTIWTKDFSVYEADSVYINNKRLLVLNNKVFIPIENVECWQMNEI